MTVTLKRWSRVTDLSIELGSTQTIERALKCASEVIITCAVTGDDPKVTKSPYSASSPQDIAQSAIDAAKAGAAIVHIHVRDPETGDYSMETRHYREVVRIIRDSGTDVLINLTAGVGGYVYVSDDGKSLAATMAPTSSVRRLACATSSIW